MSIRLEVVDETMSGDVLRTMALVLPTGTVTARTVIEQRVYEDVEAYNRDLDHPPALLDRVALAPAEVALNGPRQRPQRQRRRAKAATEVARALEAFERNGFVMLVGDRQVESLDEPLPAAETLRVSFIRLVPLVGG